MYLKKLQVQGFKSFANKTTFEFEPGITGIVGPNGSGKSNVADAVRWVLGEQSSRLLRARKQEDVIFSGAGQRSAVGMAEVLLTLDNEDRWLPVDFSEVEVGRRVYRSGESEYLLNGSRVRLREVLDLLMKGDVGQNSYTIMGQGLVDEVLSMTPEDRRNFLDEAADVKRFRLKIKEAQDRLVSTRANLDRVQLVIGEIEPRLTHLRRQADRAAEHRRLTAELIELLRAYYGQRWSDAQNGLVRARASLDQRIAEETAANTKVETLREQLRTLGEEIRKRRETLARREGRNSELESRASALEQEIALDRERHAMVSARSDEVRVEIDTLEAERMGLASTDVDEGRRGIAVVEEAEAAKSRVQQARDALDQAEREYATLRSKVQELRDGADADERRAATMEREANAATARIEDLSNELNRLEGRRKQVIAELKAYGQRFKLVFDNLRSAESLLDESREAAEASRERLRRVQEEVRGYETARAADLRELDHLEGRLDALRRVHAEHDGVTAGTRNVLIMGQALIEDVAPGSLGEAPEINGVVGLLSRQIKVPPGMEAAINAALENRLHAVIVEREADALTAIEVLARRGAGRAQFLPLESVRHVYPLNLNKERGVVGVAAKLVRCDARFRPLIDTLLGRVIIVEDAQTGLRMIRRALGSVVTLDGVYMEPSGVLTGGATGNDEGPFLRQRELEELPARIEELRARTEVSGAQLQRAQEAVEAGTKHARESENVYEQLRRQADTARQQIQREREKLHRLRRDIDHVAGRRNQLFRESQDRQTQIEQSRASAREIAARAAERRQGLDTLEAELRLATTRREDALRTVGEASGQLATIEGERRTLIAMREQHEKALERLAQQVAARRLQAKNFELEAAVIAERLEKLGKDLETVRGEASQQTDDTAPDRDELHRLEAHERQIQEDYNNSQQALLSVNRSRLDLEAEVARAEEHIEVLRLEMEREGLGPDRTGAIVLMEQAAGAEAEDGGESGQEHPSLQGSALLDLAETRVKIEDLRRQIRRLGPINEEAPEDFRESEERHAFLTTQVADLSEAEAQLRAAIQELSEEIRTRFGATFEVVNKAFSEYFEAFFGGGEATLLLTDPENIAEAGIEIEASPPGKKIKSLSLLSGGERSLTAVALLFALLSANPAPFCVLDEVDAALDEANVGRFTASLKRLAERTQFLVVTHNRRTVEVADAIYGVSMARDGVSRVLSLRLSDVPQN